jgi:hypothetical protein
MSKIERRERGEKEYRKKKRPALQLGTGRACGATENHKSIARSAERKRDTGYEAVPREAEYATADMRLRWNWSK